MVKYFSPSLLDGSVTTAKLADDAVTTPKLLDLAVVRNKIATNAIDNPRIIAGTLKQSKLNTTEVSTAGSVPGTARLSITMVAYCFWPMIHVENSTDVRLAGHDVDAPGADNPRFALVNSNAASRTYDIDYRYIVV